MNVDIIIPVAPWDDISESFSAQFHGWAGGILVVGPKKPEHMNRIQGARYICSEVGRAKQLNAAAREANGEYLWFIHVDSTLPEGFFRLSSTGHPKGHGHIALLGSGFWQPGSKIDGIKSNWRLDQVPLVEAPFR